MLVRGESFDTLRFDTLGFDAMSAIVHRGEPDELWVDSLFVTLSSVVGMLLVWMQPSNQRSFYQPLVLMG
jgi:hypothetical protein